MNLLPRRRSGRPRGAARLAPVGGIPDTSEADTDILARVRPAEWDGTTIEYSGASGAGLPGTSMQPSEKAETGLLYTGMLP